MEFFFIISLLLLFTSFFVKSMQKMGLVMVFLLLFIIVGFRTDSVGTDTQNYKAYFSLVDQGANLRVEKGWEYLNKLVLFLGGSFDGVLLMSAFLTLLPVFVVSKIKSPNPLFSIFLYYTLYFFFYSFNITRQMVAVSFVLAAMHFLISNRRTYFLIFVALATSFHLSAIISLGLLFAHKIPTSRFFYVGTIVVSAVVGLLFAPLLVNWLSQFMYDSLLEGRELGGLLGNSLFLILFNSFFLFIYSIYHNKDKVLFNVFYLYALLANIFVRIPFGSRLILYLSIIQILLLPIVVNQRNPKERGLIYGVIVVYAYIMFYRLFGAGEILPYYNRLFD